MRLDGGEVGARASGVANHLAMDADVQKRKGESKYVPSVSSSLRAPLMAASSAELKLAGHLPAVVIIVVEGVEGFVERIVVVREGGRGRVAGRRGGGGGGGGETRTETRGASGNRAGRGRGRETRGSGASRAMRAENGARARARA